MSGVPLYVIPDTLLVEEGTFFENSLSLSRM
jgi:hypothetical protein